MIGRTGTRAGLALMAALAMLGIGGCESTGPAALTAEPVERVLIVTLPGLGWSDVRNHDLPHLESLASSAAIGDISTRIRLDDAGSTDAYLTLGAGTRALAPQVDAAVAIDPDESYRGVSSADILERRLGHVSTGVAYLAMGAAAELNANSSFGAEVGTLGDALAAAGVGRAVIANADTTEEFVSAEPPPEGTYSRGAATMLVDSDGMVPGGTVSRELLTADPNAPFGLRLDRERVLSEFDEQWGTPTSAGAPRVVLVEASDLSRAIAYRPRATPERRSKIWQEALTSADDLLGALLERVDPARDAVLVLSPVSSTSTPGLGLAAATAPGIERGLLRSATTRRDGYIQLADLAPTVLSLFGAATPEAIEGRPIEVGSGAGTDRVGYLIDSATAAGFRDAQLVWFIPTVGLALAALAGGAWWLRQRTASNNAPPPGRARAGLTLAAFATLGLVPATFLAARFDWARADRAGYLLAVGAMVALATAGARWLERRRPGVGVICAVGLIVGLVALDVLVGAPLQVNTVFGYSMAIAGRFVGLGNFAFALFGTAAILLAALVVDRFGRRWLGVVVVMLVLVVILEGLPMLGADVGGTISMIPAFGVTALLLAGRRVGWVEVFALGAATVLVLGFFAVVDAMRPAGAQTHLVRFGENVVHGRWDVVFTTLGRRWQASLGDAELTGWAAVLLLVVGAGTYVTLVAAGRAGPAVAGSQQHRPLVAAAIGLVVLGVLGLVANDSSITVPATMLVVAVPVFVLRAVRAS